MVLEQTLAINTSKLQNNLLQVRTCLCNVFKREYITIYTLFLPVRNMSNFVEGIEIRRCWLWLNI